MTTHSAADSASGYLYQCRYALLAALKRQDTDPGLEVSIECFDDVAFSQSGSPTELLQAKHSLTPKTMSDMAAQFWKTIGIWTKRVIEHPSELGKIKLVFLTTATVGADTGLAHLRPDLMSRDVLAAGKQLESAAQASSNKEIAWATALFLAQPPEMREQLLQMIEVLDASPNIIDVGNDLTNAVRRACSPDHRKLFVERLDGVIRQHVAWYGVLVDRGDNRIFIARRNPSPPKTKDPDVFLLMGNGISAPEFSGLHANFTVDGIEKLLTTSVGISENITTVPAGQTRAPLKANIKHALMFCLQDQDEIDSRKVLFHRQTEPFLPQTIKDVLPYFLGAIDEDRLRQQAELDIEKKELRRLEKISSERESIATISTARTEDIYREAQAAGIFIEGPPPEHSIALAALRTINPIVREIPVPPDSAEPIANFRRRRTELRRDLSVVRERLRQTRDVENVAGGFAVEATEQRTRLASLGLANTHDPKACALCGSTDIEVPSVAEMNASLIELNEQLGQVRREVPRLQEAQVALTTRQGEIEQELKNNQQQIESVLKQEDSYEAGQDNQIRLARTIGRITYFLETLPQLPIETSSSDLDRARHRVQALEALLDPEETADRLSSILNIIGGFMTRDSDKLDLEHSGSRLRLDIRQLGIVADTLNGPIPLQRMGSGENWVGYHVLAHLALHRWFRHKQRPVPAFLFFDQPSQAHYPAERDQEGAVEGLPDEDRETVYKLFKLISDVGQELSPDFQVIITDHADILEPWFADAVVERWRGKGLIPQSWIDA